MTAKRLRSSVRKMEKTLSARGVVYDVQKTATARIEARIAAALDRIRVAASFNEFSGATVVQLQHARRFLVSGRDEPELIVKWYVDDHNADELMRLLAQMYHDSLVVELHASLAESESPEAEA